MLGYHEVGMIDGKWGGRTAAAIAAFKNDRGLTGPAVIDETLVGALRDATDEFVAGAWKRPIAEARKDVKAKDLEQDVQTVRETAWGRFWSKLGLGGAGGALTVGTAAEHLETVEPLLAPLKGVPWQVWVIIGMVLLVLLIRHLMRAEESTAQLYRDGRLVS